MVRPTQPEHRRPFFQLTYDELVAILDAQNFNTSAASRLFNDYFRKAMPSPLWHKIARETKSWLEQTFSFFLPTPIRVHQADDRTVKFLFQMEDQTTVEAVLIPFQEKYTLCLSSQVGCAMKCSFCHTGTQGFTRHLQAHEIVGQFIGARRWLQQHRAHEAKILNVVFMGQGEPLHNFDQVKRSCDILLTRQGACMAPHKITVSTSGYMPGLRRWNEEMPPVNIALSLHATDDERRSMLIPINKTYPLSEVLAYLDTIPLGEKRFLTFEYLLLAGLNDGEEDAKALGQMLQNRSAMLNIIPYNPYPGGKYHRPSEQKTEQFAALLKPYGFPIGVRSVKGEDILAACGQLKSDERLGYSLG